MPVSVASRNSRKCILNEREMEVFRLILDGKTAKEAGEILFCSRRTIEFHVAHIYKKLQVSNRCQAMRRAWTLGLFELLNQQDKSAA